MTNKNREYRRKPSVYMILNLRNNKRYIGASRYMSERWAEHKKFLANCKHPNWKLQMEWDAFGKDTFLFVSLEKLVPDISLEDLHVKEANWIKYFLNLGFDLYNMNLDGRSRTGAKLHEKQCIKCHKPHEQYNLSEVGLAAIQKATSHPRPDVAERRSKNWPDLVGPDGVCYQHIFNLLSFCRTHNLDVSALRKVCINKRPSHKGFRLAPLNQ